VSEVPVEPANGVAGRDDFPRRQRVAAYAIIIRDDTILMSRLAPYLVAREQWTLPGGGIDFGEDPRDAVVREVHEETGIDVEVGDRAWIDSARRYASVSRTNTASAVDAAAASSDLPTDMHSVRMVFEGWAAIDSPEPRVVEVDGSTVDARWMPLGLVLDGTTPVAGWVRAAIEDHDAHRVQRIAAKAMVRRGPEGAQQILLARLSRYAVESGHWTLPGGGVDHGEPPASALVREMFEETGLPATIGALLAVHDLHLTGTAPNGRHEDFHAVNLIFAVTVPDLEPYVVETDGTTDQVAWIDIAAISSGEIEVTEVVRYALASAP
jgi:8-oxo-dGTP diphosphatase